MSYVSRSHRGTPSIGGGALALMAFALALSACERPPADAPRAEDGVPCVGATPEVAASPEEYARVFKGEVFASPREAAQNQGASLWEWVVPSAHAYALEEEEPLGDATVALMRVGADGAPQGAAILETTTDEQGRYCLVAPSDDAVGMGMLLVATKADVTLRQIAYAPHDAGINSLSEATVRALHRQGVAPEALTEAAFLDFRTMSDTAVGLFGEVEVDGRTPEQLVEAMVEVLLEDERTKAWLKEHGAS